MWSGKKSVDAEPNRKKKLAGSNETLAHLSRLSIGIGTQQAFSTGINESVEGSAHPTACRWYMLRFGVPHNAEGEPLDLGRGAR
jgi:hypothetical protein